MGIIIQEDIDRLVRQGEITIHDPRPLLHVDDIHQLMFIEDNLIY